MNMYKRYSGSFLSRKNVEWRVDILQEAEQPFSGVGELVFPANSPVTISWEEKDKIDSVIGSVAEIVIISPGDRTYEDLYTVKPGRVRADIYHTDSLYWSGTLDPEFYEEPYEKGNNYEVKLTFSDLGILDRILYEGTGLLTIGQVCDLIVAESKISTAGIDSSLISTSFDGTTPITPSDIELRADNFYDEEGEAMSISEVAEAAFTPLGLRIMQRCGKLWLYDLNGLYEKGVAKNIVWSSDRQTLGVDKVYNKVNITFSPYADSTVGDFTFDHDAVHKNDKEPILYYLDYNWDRWQTTEGFRFYAGDRFDENRFEGLPVHPIGGGAPFRIDPVYSGSEDAGVAWLWRGSKDNYDEVFTSDRFVTSNTAVRLIRPGKNDADIRPMIATQRVPLYPGVTERNKYKLRICCDLLLDTRYNPFEQASEFNEQGHYDMQQRMKKVFVPARLILHLNNGLKFHYANHKMLYSDTFARTEYNTSLRPDTQVEGECGWRLNEGNWGEFWLSYYDITNLENSYGNGWVSNRPIVGASWFSFLPRLWGKRQPGEYIILPDFDGELELQIGTGIYCSECLYPDGNFVETTPVGYNVRNMRWMLFRNISVSIVKENGEDTGASDIEYSATIDPEAKEDLKIDTKCGAARENTVGAKGLYFRSDSHAPIQKLTRANVSDYPEQLLINTIYSQYADRHTKLSGEAEIETSGIGVYSERCQNTRRFMIVGETQNLISDVSDIVAVELSPDEYEAQ